MQPVSPTDRYRGSLLGLAAGDALGTALEFRTPGSFQPLTDMIGGGSFGLKPGQWTDDTSMALVSGGESDRVRGLRCWRPDDPIRPLVSGGYHSSTGEWGARYKVVGPAAPSDAQAADGLSGVQVGG